jgi:chemotaxis-related protein WspB
MLLLALHIDAHRYAIDCTQVVEVLPFIAIDALSQASAAVAGVVVYRGTAVPVIDLSQVLAGRPAHGRLSTRLVIVRCSDARGEPRLAAVIAEKATELLRRDTKDFLDAGVRPRGAPYLGPVAIDAQGVLQHLDIARLIDDRLQPVVTQPTESACLLPTSNGC